MKLKELRRRNVERVREEKLEELENQVVVLLANEDRLQMEHKAEVDNLLGQVSILMEKCKNIADDAVFLTRASIMHEYKEGKADSWDVDGAIEAWEEIKALAVKEKDKAPVVNDTPDSQVETGHASVVEQKEQ
ncbi:hypothetical protein ACOSP7_016756 [Xanthoceras sorbifolium]